MPKLFSENVINEVIDRSNIVELISSYIPLKRAGRNYKSPCPFHPEKTPSFIVSADKQIFHCFGCGVGGNALSFVMQYEKVNFREALEILAQRSGITLPEPDKNDFQRSREDIAKNLYALYETTSVFFHTNLMNSTEAQSTRMYLQKRGISKETAAKFRLGYSMQGWDALIKHLKSKDVSLSLIERSGLVVAKEDSGYYDRFRNRIMFPIIDIKDRAIGFGARVLPGQDKAEGDNSQPKYINSPETPIYSKSKNLYGLIQAKEEIRKKDQAIVVEGYLDMILPFETGINNVVASLGTALTIEQIHLIKRYTNHVVMLYDADLAGQLATMRALELLIKEDMDVRVAALPKGHDPDTYARQFGKEKFLDMIEKAKPIFDYKLSYLLSKYDPRTTIGKDKIVREILPAIKKFQNHTLRTEYVRITADKLKVDEKALLEDLKNTKENDYENEKTESSALEHYKLTEIPITERMLVKLMLDEIHLVDQLRTQIEPSDFVEEKLRKIVQFIFDFFSQGRDCKPNILMNYLDDEEAINIISELAALDIHDCPDKEKLITDCVKRLKRDKHTYRCKQLHKEIQTAQSNGNGEILNKLILEYNTLIKQRSQLNGKICN
ncbi:MAG: DNA primase [Candidatus Omnitrophica bacterium CG1_02_44_16]|nr:MAG: DNA primase [Candidatus Omnitrophica bacterium CG1_02_44_16]PIY83173.1 MAG: DNA primase [Candidatus Omnitrophica bacterium CG_4_10_14_0_8_um_filter_44_12]PIZ84019.1 MAG: DNA primase [Candidatus Omnitrophica bacterium CG_4_10_14_0_2_um_filter_44_9]